MEHRLVMFLRQLLWSVVSSRSSKAQNTIHNTVIENTTVFFTAGFAYYLDCCVFRSRFTVLTVCFIFGDVFWRFIVKHTFWETLSNKFKKKKTWTLRVLIKMLMSFEEKNTYTRFKTRCVWSVLTYARFYLHCVHA